MRVLLELILAAAILALASEKPLKEQVNHLPWMTDKTAPAAKMPVPAPHPLLQPQPMVTLTPAVHPTSTVAGSWLWDPSHRSTLDPSLKKHPPSTPH